MQKLIIFIPVFIFFTIQLNSQEIQIIFDEKAASLVSQINSLPDVKTIAIADFYNANSFSTSCIGEYFADELTTSLVLQKNKNFSIIDRNQFQALLSEAKLDMDGLFAPKNKPNLNRLKKIDLIISASMLDSYNEYVVTLHGNFLETQEVPVAERMRIPNIPSFSKECDEDEKKTTNKSTENVQINEKGCFMLGDKVICHFELSSLNTSETIHLLANEILVSTDLLSESNTPLNLEINNTISNSRISLTLIPGETNDLTITMPKKIIKSVKKISIEVPISSNSSDKKSFSFNNIKIN